MFHEIFKCFELLRTYILKLIFNSRAKSGAAGQQMFCILDIPKSFVKLEGKRPKQYTVKNFAQFSNLSLFLNWNWK